MNWGICILIKYYTYICWTMATSTQTQPASISEELQGPLLEVVDSLKELLIESLKQNDRVASGKTIDQLETSATDSSAQLTAPWWFYALQGGRKPTKDGAEEGDPSLFEQIKQWCIVKGIDIVAAYPITKKIHREGYEGTPGLIDEPLSDDNIDKAMNNALGQIAGLFTNVISDQFKTA